MKVTFCGNPAALGATVLDDDGSEFQLAVPRGTQTVLFALRWSSGADAGKWSRTTTVEAPERFGAIPTNRAEMLAYARRFASDGKGDL